MIKWNLGIDFGTSNTYIYGSYKDDSNSWSRWKLVDLTQSIRKPGVVHKQGNLCYGIPTAIYWDGSQWQIGDAAKDQAEKNISPYVVTDIKMQIRCNFLAQKVAQLHGKDGVREEDAIGQTTYKELAISFLTEVLKCLINVPLKGKDGSELPKITATSLNQVVIGCPNDENTVSLYGDEIVDIVREALLCCSITDCHIIFHCESKLAAYAYIEYANLEEFKNSDNPTILVVDAGGGTTDFCILCWHKRAEKFLVMRGGTLGTRGGVYPAGDDYDRSILHQMRQKVGQEVRCTNLSKVKEYVVNEFIKTGKPMMGRKMVAGNAMQIYKGASTNTSYMYLHYDVPNGARLENDEIVFNADWDCAQSDIPWSVPKLNAELALRAHECMIQDADENGNTAGLWQAKEECGLSRKPTYCAKILFMGGTSYIPSLRDAVAKKCFNSIHYNSADLLTFAPESIEESNPTAFSAVAFGGCVYANNFQIATNYSRGLKLQITSKWAGEQNPHTEQTFFLDGNELQDGVILQRLSKKKYTIPEGKSQLRFYIETDGGKTIPPAASNNYKSRLWVQGAPGTTFSFAAIQEPSSEMRLYVFNKSEVQEVSRDGFTVDSSEIYYYSLASAETDKTHDGYRRKLQEDKQYG